MATFDPNAAVIKALKRFSTRERKEGAKMVAALSPDAFYRRQAQLLKLMIDMSKDDEESALLRRLMADIHKGEANGDD